MTRDADDGDGPAGPPEDDAIARHNWIAEQLGEQWRPDGDGVYRFVEPPDSSFAVEPPHGHDEETHESALLPWLEQDETNGPPAKRPRSSHLPWRRR